MFDERAFTARLEAADTDELGNLLAHPAADEERVFRAYLGDERYQRLHSMALRRSATCRTDDRPPGNVVVIHGFLGSELTAQDRTGAADRIWVDALRIAAGRLSLLRLADDGRTEHELGCSVRPTGILKRCYGELLLSLAESWNVRVFTYDWRKDLDVAAAELAARLRDWFDDDAPVHLVAHAMGGLVARTFIRNYPDRWATMWDKGKERKRPEGTNGGRLVMLGTPNHGSFAILQSIFGLSETLSTLDRLDVHHTKRDLMDILNSFVATYQLLPSPFKLRTMERLYDAKTYGELNVLQSRLDNAHDHHKRLRGIVDPRRMVSVVGNNRPTPCGVTNFNNLDDPASYRLTWQGDGWVPHKLSQLTDDEELYCVDDDHGGLPANRRLLAALDDLLMRGTTSHLSTIGHANPHLSETEREETGADALTEEEAKIRLTGDRATGSKLLETLLGRSRSWRIAATGTAARGGTGTLEAGTDRVAAAGEVAFVSNDERQIEELIPRGVAGSSGDKRRAAGVEVPFGPATIELGVAGGSIADLIGIEGIDSKPHPIDAIAIGQYLGAKPQGAMLALDQSISACVPGARARGKGEGLPEADLLITQFVERGTIRGELGETFYLSDPRPTGRNGGAASDRVIAIAGMGVAGTFGSPELTVLARELCWALGRMGKRHLATVLIGAGNGNLDAREATLAWIRGIKNAITGSAEDEMRRLRSVTFVERDPDRIEAIQEAIQDEQVRLQKEKRLDIRFQPLANDELARVAARWDELKRAEEEESRQKHERDPDALPPTRLTVTLDRGTYRFGAITESASIPEREITIDIDLVAEANDQLVAALDDDDQYERGQYLEQLLLPDELRTHVYSAAPLVLMLDATTARIHWEMVAQSDPASGRTQPRDGVAADRIVDEFDRRRFLGTGRSVTRQLRTIFSPPPEPPPPPRRVMRVLVVADPAEDAPLLGAEEEGVAVADLFERFNTVYEQLSKNRVEVVRLLGPQEATRYRVLSELMLRRYDVLHFSGHCKYNRDVPAASGWLFSKGERITANELDRIDRIPKFVFSNACESGITPDRSEQRSVGLAPSFAESFFARGVSNFVCTAWPVNDVAARAFALKLYEHLLGLQPEGSDQSRQRYIPRSPMPMHIAMREARLAIAPTSLGTQTWGAYQHYGSPYLRFFDPASIDLTPREESRNAFGAPGVPIAAPPASPEKTAGSNGADPSHAESGPQPDPAATRGRRGSELETAGVARGKTPATHRRFTGRV